MSASPQTRDLFMLLASVSRRARFRVLLGLITVMLVLVLAPPGRAGAADLQANPSSLGSVFAAAQPGDVIHLAAGDYGTFAGGAKPGMVTIVADPGVAASLTARLNGASFVRFSGLTIGSAEVRGSHHVEFVGNRFVGHTLIETNANADLAIRLDANTHHGINVCSSCHEGRVTVKGFNNTTANGVVISNSSFTGGNSDGVQVVGKPFGTQIGPGNRFVDIPMIDDTHTDAIQLYGSRYTRITGNLIYRTETGIMAPDGADHETIDNNVISTLGYPWGIVLGSDQGSVIRHNTLPDGACSGTPAAASCASTAATAGVRAAAPSSRTTCWARCCTAAARRSPTATTTSWPTAVSGAVRTAPGCRGSSAAPARDWAGYAWPPARRERRPPRTARTWASCQPPAGAGRAGVAAGHCRGQRPAPARPPGHACRSRRRRPACGSASDSGHGRRLGQQRHRQGRALDRSPQARRRPYGALRVRRPSGRRLKRRPSHDRRARLRERPPGGLDGHDRRSPASGRRTPGPRQPYAGVAGGQPARAPAARCCGRWPRRRRVTVALARCGDRKGRTVQRIRARNRRDGTINLKRRRAGLCVVGLR